MGVAPVGFTVSGPAGVSDAAMGVEFDVEVQLLLTCYNQARYEKRYYNIIYYFKYNMN